MTLPALALLVATSTAPPRLTGYEQKLYHALVLAEADLASADILNAKLGADLADCRANNERDEQRLLAAPPAPPNTTIPPFVLAGIGAALLVVGFVAGAAAF